MDSQFNSWESYFYPETYDPSSETGTLVNLLDERDDTVLQRREYARTHLRYRQLRTGQASVERTWDADQVRAIHRHLFQDLYPWAGEYRTVAMTKNVSQFADPGDIGYYLNRAHQTIAQTTWAELDREGFAAAAAQTYAYLNQAHPFREGNGRTSKLFMQQVAEESRFRITYDPDLTGITDAIWNQQSMLSSPDLGSSEPVPHELVPVFYALAQPAGTDKDVAHDQATEAARLTHRAFGTTGRQQPPTMRDEPLYGRDPGNEQGRGR